MIYTGTIKKMRTELSDGKPSYYLPIGDFEIAMNAQIGRKIKIHYNGAIYCIRCGKRTKTSFSQGFCYPCFTSAPETEECVLRPELCRAHEGIARNMEYASTHCLAPQYVYLAVSSGIKVGVTRNTQIPTRWIDQGASYAMVIAQGPNRYTAGLIEVALKEFYADKTNWQQMLKNQQPDSIDLAEQRQIALSHLPEHLKQFVVTDGPKAEICYPVEMYPAKVKALSLDKEAIIEEQLVGIKGQYLIFEGGKVLNIRKFTGYELSVETEL